MPPPLEHVLSFRQFVVGAAENLLNKLYDESTTNAEIGAAAQGLLSSIRALAKSAGMDEADLWDTAVAVLEQQ